MRFLIDAQLPPALARALSAEGHHAEHLEDVELRHAKDKDVWNFALRNHAVLLTKDEDFVDHFKRHPDAPVIVWVRIGNAPKQALVTNLLSSLTAIIQRIEAGDRFIEVR